MARWGGRTVTGFEAAIDDWVSVERAICMSPDRAWYTFAFHTTCLLEQVYTASSGAHLFARAHTAFYFTQEPSPKHLEEYQSSTRIQHLLIRSSVRLVLVDGTLVASLSRSTRSKSRRRTRRSKHRVQIYLRRISLSKTRKRRVDF